MAKKITIADPAHKETDKLISKLTKKLRHTYSKAYGDAAEKFMNYMAVFEAKDRAHKADVAAGKWTEQEYTNWRRNQLLYADTLAGIRDTLAQDLHNVNKIAMKMVREEQVDVYALNHNYGTYEVEHGLGIDTSFTLYDHDTVERLMKEDPNLLPKPSARRQAEIDAKDIAWNKQKLTSTFTASILAGDSIPKMAEHISTVASMDLNAAVRNARTMCTGAENAGRCDSYKRAKGMGIDMRQEWQSTLDERTRDSHVELDGEIIEVGQRYSNGLRYPGDPEGPAAEVYNCRCCQIAVVNGIDPGAFDKTATLQRKLGNKDITYEKWKEEHRRKKKPTPDFLMQKKAGTSNEEQFAAYKVSMNAFSDIPVKAMTTVGEFVVESGHSNSKCDWRNKKILMGVNPTKEQFYHEYGHLIEHYALNEDDVREYQEYLVEGLTADDIVSETWQKNDGTPVQIYRLKGERFETEYQSRLYIRNPAKALNDDGSINVDSLWECVSEAFKKWMQGGKISKKAYKLLRKAVKYD